MKSYTGSNEVVVSSLPVKVAGKKWFCGFKISKASSGALMGDKTSDSGNRMLRRHLGAWVTLLAVAIAAVVLVWAAIFASNNIPDMVGRPLTTEEQVEIISRNSPLASYVYLSPNANFPRTQPIRKITIHHMADDDMSLERLGETFGQRDRRASSNYAIDKDGNVALYVEEANRAWTSGNAENDQQAVTIEVENSEMGGQWRISNESYWALINLCVDICQRNGIESLEFTGNPQGNLTYHHMFDAGTQCPGPYLVNRMAQIAEDVNTVLKNDSSAA